jgi:hypothetical protein
VQAPKTRKDDRARRGLVLLVAAAAVLIAVGGAAAYFILRDTTSASQDVEKTVIAAGGTFKEVPALAAGVHIADPDKTPKEWNTFPPTSGPHYAQPVLWGDYEDPVRLTQSVHNLEHGGIVIYYGKDVSQAQIEELRRFYRDDPDAMLLAPLPRLGDKIALTAWYAPHAEQPGQARKDAKGVLVEFTSFDEGAFKAFRSAYRFKGPERFPPESLQPGM